MSFTSIPIPAYSDISALQFRDEIQPRRRPALLRGLELGPWVERWKNVDYLLSNIEDKAVKVG